MERNHQLRVGIMSGAVAIRRFTKSHPPYNFKAECKGSASEDDVEYDGAEGYSDSEWTTDGDDGANVDGADGANGDTDIMSVSFGGEMGPHRGGLRRRPLRSSK